MKKSVCFLLFTLLFHLFAVAQPKFYFLACERADSLYEMKEYLQSAYVYNQAFEAYRGKALQNDRYNAARSWAAGSEPDSALRHLETLVYKNRYAAYHRLYAEAAFNSLHNNIRWKNLMDTINVIEAQHKAKSDSLKKLFEPELAARLDTIYKADQYDRKLLAATEKQYGADSKEVKQLWANIHYNDSMNLIQVKQILDTRGWLGPEIVHSGSNTLFLVIQHSDLNTQLQYLPLMRAAAKNGKLPPGSLAMLEDRVLLGLNKKQIYGTQIRRDPVNGKRYVAPLLDPEKVDERRAEVGLGPLSDYVSNWDLTWDAEKYKKEEAERENKGKTAPVAKPIKD